MPCSPPCSSPPPASPGCGTDDDAAGSGSAALRVGYQRFGGLSLERRTLAYESLLLADRALVLAGGRIAADLPVPLDYPRVPDAPGFGELRRRLLDLLGVPLACATRAA